MSDLCGVFGLQVVSLDSLMITPMHDSAVHVIFTTRTTPVCFDEIAIHQNQVVDRFSSPPSVINRHLNKYVLGWRFSGDSIFVRDRPRRFDQLVQQYHNEWHLQDEHDWSVLADWLEEHGSNDAELIRQRLYAGAGGVTR